MKDTFDLDSSVDYIRIQDETYKIKDRQDTFSNIDEFSFELEPKWLPEKDRISKYDYSFTVNVFDVAAYILKKMGPMTTMKLQKLVYYCQAWSLVWDEAPLFKEPIEAWANGPVVKDLFSYHRGIYQISSIPIGNPDLLTQPQNETIDAVLEFYGDKSSQWLIELTHMEEPWKKTREGLPNMARSNRVIKLDDMAEYYSSLPENN